MVTNSMPPRGRCRRRMGAGGQLLRQFRALFAPGHPTDPRHQCNGYDDHRSKSHVSHYTLRQINVH